MRLTSIGIETATMLEREVFFRPFANRRSVASYVGLSPSPYQSGDRNHEQGISKAGNRRARSTAIELAWLWLQHQPDSALSQWYRAKLGENQGKRLKKILIVALARKLVVALWRYVTTGLVPEGVRLKRKQRKARCKAERAWPAPRDGRVTVPAPGVHHAAAVVEWSRPPPVGRDRCRKRHCGPRA